MHNHSKQPLILIAAICLILIFSGLIAALVRLINIPAILLTLLILCYFIYQKRWNWLRRFFLKRILIHYKNNYRRFSPKSSRQAARRSLESIDRLIDRIHNNVSAEALKQRRASVEQELVRGDITVVLFGTGSSGKTTLIRALLKEIVGEVSATMGTTKTSHTYRLRLKGLERGIQIIDTPGILETGEEGNKREKESFLKASRADLIIVVVDTDLRSIEMKLIATLAKGGKRLLLVLNKCDLRGEEEIRRLLLTLRRHTKDLINPEDVIATSASPQSIPVPGGYPLQPLPEIDGLIRQVARILHEEGEELIASNILLQCKNLGDSGRKLLTNQRKIAAKNCVERYAWISSGVVAITPLPGVDMIGAAAVNGQMVMEIARNYGLKLTRKRSQELALSVGRTLAGLGIVKGGMSIISNSLSLTLPTIVIGKVVQGITAAWLTKVAGESFITYFSQDQDWGDGGIQEVVQRHYNLYRRESSLKSFIQTALDRVVEPLKEERRRELPPHLKLREEEEVEDL
ncbi:YcjF family protein [Prochlorococcus marinus]|uniref:GTPase SAR1 and related small G protein n=1 Tax=Prochlorococcus marinus (strain MIT 9211) TaxID=93059 RepID=A9BAU1_PROM4|nr:DUF697 domain-containing protein [Prochlorococcus marinus]ABX08953.1 GTPase SAR1 and related small G protein [Prochlorococcus marinus str. MIT 9211]